MPDNDSRRTQLLALALILSAAVCIGIGEHFNWIHMIDFANAFGGAGVGILTGQKMSQNTKSGDILNPTSPNS
jgi:hypothetical protein